VVKHLLRVVCWFKGHDDSPHRELESGKQWGPGHVDPIIVSIYDCDRCGQRGTLETWQWKADVLASRAYWAEYE
jgi:hypothetical protein